MDLYETKKEFKIAGQRGFVFNQILKLTLKFFTNLSSINICYYLKFRIPMRPRQFFRIKSQNSEYVEVFCKILNIPFYFACPKWKVENSS